MRPRIKGFVREWVARAGNGRLDKLIELLRTDAGIDNFTLGPLTVHGVDSPRATVDVAIGLSRQHILIDGQVTFFDAQAALHAEVGMLPTPTFDFYMVGTIL